MIRSIFILLSLAICCSQTSGQCIPEFATSCNNAYVFCSLDALNGYTCVNNSTDPGHCPMPCSQGGVAHNTNWLAFVSDGGTKTFTLTIGTCVTFQGLQFGIWGDCNCTEEIYCYSIPCAPPLSVQSFAVDLLPCKTYYMWIDGCSGDVCDFTINTSGGGLGPPLDVPRFINNIDRMVIDPVCTGACNYRFSIDPQTSGCYPTYVWTLDGDEVGGNSNVVLLDFPDEGDFQICVTVMTGNPNNGDICSQTGPRCATVKVRPNQDRIGQDIILCHEQVIPGGYKLHSQRVFQSGFYREQFTDSICCTYDSLWNVTVLEHPEASEVYYITCDNSPYVDASGKSWEGCRNQFQITIPKSTDPNQCDSSILLTSVQVNFESTMKYEYDNGKLLFNPESKISRPCNVGETYAFFYSWREKSDTTATIISTDERLLVSQEGDFVVDVIVLCILGNDSLYCRKSFYENFNEKVLLKPLILTRPYVCLFDTVWVHGNSPFSHPMLEYIWSVQGGVILSRPDSSSILVHWNNVINEKPIVSLSVKIDTFVSAVNEIFISIPNNNVLSKDFSVFGKTSKLQVNSTLPGRWSIISGPHSAFIDGDSLHTTRVNVEGFGSYCFEWLADLTNCEERDTLCINFKDIITYDDKEERKHERDSLKGKITTRFSKDKVRDHQIESISSDYVIFRFDQSVSKLSDIEWIDLQGKSVSVVKNKMEIDDKRLKVYTPELSGLYFLKLKSDAGLIVYKIFVNRN